MFSLTIIVLLYFHLQISDILLNYARINLFIFSFMQVLLSLAKPPKSAMDKPSVIPFSLFMSIALYF